MYLGDNLAYQTSCYQGGRHCFLGISVGVFRGPNDSGWYW